MSSIVFLCVVFSVGFIVGGMWHEMHKQNKKFKETISDE